MLVYIRIPFRSSRLNSVFWTNVSSANRQSRYTGDSSKDLKRKKDEARREQANKRAIGRNGQADGQDIAVGGLLDMGRVADELSAE